MWILGWQNQYRDKMTHFRTCGGSVEKKILYRRIDKHNFWGDKLDILRNSTVQNFIFSSKNNFWPQKSMYHTCLNIQTITHHFHHHHNSMQLFQASKFPFPPWLLQTLHKWITCNYKNTMETIYLAVEIEAVLFHSKVKISHHIHYLLLQLQLKASYHSSSSFHPFPAKLH